MEELISREGSEKSEASGDMLCGGLHSEFGLLECWAGELGCRILQKPCPILHKLQLFSSFVFEKGFQLCESFFGFFQSHRAKVAVFYFVNHSWKKLPVVDVGLVILDS